MNNSNYNRVVVCSVLIAGQKVSFSVPLQSKGLVYSGQHAQYFPIVDSKGAMKDGVTLKPRKAGGYSIECSRIIIAEGGRSHVPSGEWHNGLRYTVSIKLESMGLALVTLRIETFGSDVQQFVAAHIATDTDLVNAANALRRSREAAAQAKALVDTMITPEEMAQFKAWKEASNPKASNPKAQPIDAA